MDLSSSSVFVCMKIVVHWQFSVAVQLGACDSGMVEGSVQMISGE